MQKRFAQSVEDIEGRISEWSAPLYLSSGRPRYLAAVSGGADSMCLADLCLRVLGPERFAVAHCNFHLRGDESDGDEILVSAWAAENGVEFHRTDFDTETYASDNGISIEMAARDLRYSWFAELCGIHGFAGVMTAHNANDNAETLILNLLRGAGLHGISGMDEVSYWTDQSQEEGSSRSVRIIRPMLSFTRSQIEGYAFAWKIRFRNDSTNSLSDYKRNRIRNEVFPHFEKINPSFVRTLNREMGYFSEADAIMEDWCRSRVAGICRKSPDQEGDGIVIDVKGLLKEAHWKYLLYHLLAPYGFHSSTIASVESLLTSDRTVSGKRFESEKYVLLTERSELVIAGIPSENPYPSGNRMQEDAIMPVRTPGRYHFNGRTFRVEVFPRTDGFQLRQPQGVLVMDADSLPFPLVCRRWRAGDWFNPFGMKGKKKVSDLFADLKYDSRSKDAAVMLIDCRQCEMEENHVAAVLGVRIDNRYRVTENTENIIRISYE